MWRTLIYPLVGLSAGLGLVAGIFHFAGPFIVGTPDAATSSGYVLFWLCLLVGSAGFITGSVAASQTTDLIKERIAFEQKEEAKDRESRRKGEEAWRAQALAAAAPENVPVWEPPPNLASPFDRESANETENGSKSLSRKKPVKSRG